LNTNELRGAIHRKFSSQQEFSNAMGWNANRTTRVLRGKADLDSKAIIRVIKILDLKQAEAFRIFLEE